MVIVECNNHDWIEVVFTFSSIEDDYRYMQCANCGKMKDYVKQRENNNST